MSEIQNITWSTITVKFILNVWIATFNEMIQNDVCDNDVKLLISGAASSSPSKRICPHVG